MPETNERTDLLMDRHVTGLKEELTDEQRGIKTNPQTKQTHGLHLLFMHADVQIDDNEMVLHSKGKLQYHRLVT